MLLSIYRQLGEVGFAVIFSSIFGGAMILHGFLAIKNKQITFGKRSLFNFRQFIYKEEHVGKRAVVWGWIFVILGIFIVISLPVIASGVFK